MQKWQGYGYWLKSLYHYYRNDLYKKCPPPRLPSLAETMRAFEAKQAEQAEQARQLVDCIKSLTPEQMANCHLDKLTPEQLDRLTTQLTPELVDFITESTPEQLDYLDKLFKFLYHPNTPAVLDKKSPKFDARKRALMDEIVREKQFGHTFVQSELAKIDGPVRSIRHTVKRKRKKRRKALHCRFCNRTLSEDEAFGCESCGAYVCEECCGPDGVFCINCYETGEDGNFSGEDEWDEDECEEGDEGEGDDNWDDEDEEFG